jgi:hypothetical protein
MQKLHAQAAMGKRRRGQNFSKERNEASADSDASEGEDRSAARVAARSIRRSRKQHDAAASTASSHRAHADSKRHARESRGVTHAGAESEANQDGSSSEAEEEESSSSSSTLSELSEVDEDADEDMKSYEESALLDAFDKEADADSADEWRPGAHPSPADVDRPILSCAEGQKIANATLCFRAHPPGSNPAARACHLCPARDR